MSSGVQLRFSASPVKVRSLRHLRFPLPPHPPFPFPSPARSRIMPTMNTRLLSGIVVALSLTVVANAALQPLAAQVQHAECSHLTTLKLPDVKVTEAVAVPAADTGPVRVAHCRVGGTIEKDIRFSLLLPDEWNRKFMMGGGGGFVAGIDNQARASVNAGYATVGTDTGHQGGVATASWALNDLERQLNFGYIAVHR